MPDKPPAEKAPMPGIVTQTAAVEFNYPETTPTYYARVITGQADEYEIVLSFFDPRLPVFVGSEEAMRAQAAAIASIRADCVARVILVPERVPELIKVLETALAVYQAQHPSK